MPQWIETDINIQKYDTENQPMLLRHAGGDLHDEAHNLVAHWDISVNGDAIYVYVPQESGGKNLYILPTAQILRTVLKLEGKDVAGFAEVPVIVNEIKP